MNEPPIHSSIDPSFFTSTLQSPNQYIKTELIKTQQYFSPFRYSTEDQLIEQIHSIGDQINQIENSLSLSKEKGHYLNIIDSHESLQKYKGKIQKSSLNFSNSHQAIQKTNLNPKTTKQTKNKPKNSNKINTIKQNISHYLSKSQQKVIHNHKKDINQQINQQHNTKQQRFSKDFTQINLTQKEINNRKITSKINQHIHPDPHHNKFIQSNITKLVKHLQQEKQIIQPSNTYISTPIKVSNKTTLNNTTTQNNKKHHNQTTSFNQSLILQESLLNSREKINQTNCFNLFNNSRMMLQRKQQKIQKYKQQKIQKELLQTTFEPTTFTSKYQSKNEYVSQKKNLKNFIKRQQANTELKRKNHFKQLKQQMQQYSFHPRLNVKSKHSSSIIKEIWNSTSLSKQSLSNSKQPKLISKQPKLISKLQNNQSIHHNFNIQHKKSIDNSLYNSKRSTLFNQSTQISVQDSKELSFLLK